MGSFDVPLDDERTQLDAFIEEYRGAIEMTLDSLTEEQARRRLVSSATTLLGLLSARSSGAIGEAGRAAAGWSVGRVSVGRAVRLSAGRLAGGPVGGARGCRLAGWAGVRLSVGGWPVGRRGLSVYLWPGPALCARHASVGAEVCKPYVVGMTSEVLLSKAYVVTPVPSAESGVAWLRAGVARFSEGAEHERRRGFVRLTLSTVDLEALRRPGMPVAVLAEALGLPRSVAGDVVVVARCYQPHVDVTPEADEAVARMVAACGGVWDEETANRIGLLVQACDATRALIAGVEPPVPVTRRVAPDGSVVEVDLRDAWFGAGRHECPGRAHALALVEGARAFHRLHDDFLVLPNAWDYASAAALVRAGFPAVGTTSLGVAAAHGIPDAAGAARAETLALARMLVRLPVPVTVDVEAGFGGDVGALAAELWEMGVAGVNVEDGRGEGLADPAEQAAIVRAFKDAAPGMFVNARVDTHWLAVDRDSTLPRAQAYVDAGADGIFVPGLTDEHEIANIVTAIPVPLNVLAQQNVRVLKDLGVRRVSTGSLLFRAALAETVRTAKAVRDGTPTPADIPTYDETQSLTTP